MKAARAWHVRPTKYLSSWSRRDRGLAEGLIAYEESLNPVGLPPHVAQDPDRVFEVDEREDQAMKALEVAQEEYQRGGNATPGLRLVVVDRGVRRE